MMRTREEILKDKDTTNASLGQLEVELDNRDLLIGLLEQISRMSRLMESIEYQCRVKKRKSLGRKRD